MLQNIVLVTVSGQVQRVATPEGRQRQKLAPGASVQTVNQRALAVALDLAGGDRSRLRFLPDGSVLVGNHRRAQ